MKILIIGDNLGGGGAILGSAIVNEIALEDYASHEFMFWFSNSVVIPSKLVKLNRSPSPIWIRLLPRWILRAMLTRSINDLDIVLNLTNFPIGILGSIFKKKSYKEICLFHNAYFFSYPETGLKKATFNFVFREIFLRRLMLIFLYKLFMSKNSVIVVQSFFMKQLAEKFFKKRDIKVASLHKPPLIEISINNNIEPVIHNLSEFWFYPASGEPHKNHHILIDLCKKAISLGLQPRVLVTIDENSRYGKKFLHDVHINQLNKFIVNIGWISGAFKYKLYKNCKGLLFLSVFESLGIPLLEARHLNLKILCAKSRISDEVLGVNYLKFDLSKDDDLILLLKTFSNSLPFDSMHSGELSEGILQSYLLNFCN